MDNEKRKKLRASIREKALKGMSLTEEEAKELEIALEEAKRPIILEDKDIKMAEREVDIRKLSPESRDQINFRMDTVKIATLRSIDASMVDIMRLLMLVLDEMGVTDITKALDNLQEKVHKKVNELKN